MSILLHYFANQGLLYSRFIINIEAEIRVLGDTCFSVKHE